VQFVTLEPIVDDGLLERVAVLAATDAAPGDALPGAEGERRWTPGLREDLRAFHRSRFGGLEGPTGEVALAVSLGGEVVGVARLRHLADGRHELHLWIAESRRGEGLGTAAVAELRALAPGLGAHELVAATTSANPAALALLRRHGAHLSPAGGGAVQGRF
jgi:RimJ/RimL family protein N-acetyltransferase